MRKNGKSRKAGCSARTVVQVCASPMKNKLESDPKFTELQKQYNVVGLLDLIKDLVYSIDESQEPILVMADAMCKLHMVQQGLTEDKSNYYKRLVSCIEVTESIWGGPLVQPE